MIFLRLKSINEQSVNFQRRVPDETGVCALFDYVATAQVSERRVDVSMEEIWKCFTHSCGLGLKNRHVF